MKGGKTFTSPVAERNKKGRRGGDRGRGSVTFILLKEEVLIWRKESGSEKGGGGFHGAGGRVYHNSVEETT